MNRSAAFIGVKLALLLFLGSCGNRAPAPTNTANFTTPNSPAAGGNMPRAAEVPKPRATPVEAVEPSVEMRPEWLIVEVRGADNSDGWGIYKGASEERLKLPELQEELVSYAKRTDSGLKGMTAENLSENVVVIRSLPRAPARYLTLIVEGMVRARLWRFVVTLPGGKTERRIHVQLPIDSGNDIPVPPPPPSSRDGDGVGNYVEAAGQPDDDPMVHVYSVQRGDDRSLRFATRRGKRKEEHPTPSWHLDKLAPASGGLDDTGYRSLRDDLAKVILKRVVEGGSNATQVQITVTFDPMVDKQWVSYLGVFVVVDAIDLLNNDAKRHLDLDTTLRFADPSRGHKDD